MGFVPDIHIYNILIHGFFKDGKVDEARNLFQNILLKGLRPCVVTYTSMIQGFCQEGLLEEAYKILLEMEEHTCLPTEATYNILIRGCFKNKMYDGGCLFIDDMVAHGFKADASTASIVFDLLQLKEQDPALLALQKKFMP